MKNSTPYTSRRHSCKIVRALLSPAILIAATFWTPLAEAVVTIAGSDTVESIVVAATEKYVRANPKAVVKITAAGTGAGFSAICKGEADIAMASRPINGKENAACLAGSKDYIELPIAWDAVALISHSDNTWLRDLTIAEVRNLWMMESVNKVTQWNHVRSGFPKTKIAFAAPDIKSGTADFFSTALIGEPKRIRADYRDFADHAKVIEFVAATPGAMGFVSFLAYMSNPQKTTLVAVDEGKGAGLPSVTAIASGQYGKFARLLFIYVNKNAYETKPDVQDYVNFLFSGAGRFAADANAVPLTTENYAQFKGRLRDRQVGSTYGGI